MIQQREAAWLLLRKMCYKNPDCVKLRISTRTRSFEVVLKTESAQTLCLQRRVTLLSLCQPGLSQMWNMLPDTGQDKGTQTIYYEEGSGNRWTESEQSEKGVGVGGGTQLPGKAEHSR